MDKNFDGVLSKTELVEYFGGVENTETAMKIGDWNLNGVLDYYEFLSVIVKCDLFLSD